MVGGGGGKKRGTKRNVNICFEFSFNICQQESWSNNKFHHSIQSKLVHYNESKSGISFSNLLIHLLHFVFMKYSNQKRNSLVVYFLFQATFPIFSFVFYNSSTHEFLFKFHFLTAQKFPIEEVEHPYVQIECFSTNPLQIFHFQDHHIFVLCLICIAKIQIAWHFSYLNFDLFKLLEYCSMEIFS